MRKTEYPTAIIIIVALVLFVLAKILFSPQKINIDVGDQAFLFTNENTSENISCKKNMHIVIDPIYFVESHKKEYFIANNISNENLFALLNWIEELNDEYRNHSKNFDLYIVNYYKKIYGQISKRCTFSKIDYLLIKRRYVKNYCHLSLSSLSAKTIFKMTAPPIKNLVKNLQKEISKWEDVLIYRVDINRSCGLRRENFNEIVSILESENFDAGE